MAAVSPKHFLRDEGSSCDLGNDYDGDLGLRIGAIFVILVGSTGGALLPILLHKWSTRALPRTAFFFAKYFGSGVIVATAYIHLLVPAIDALTNPCLTGVITEYDWVEGIVLISIFCLFVVEVLLHRFGKFESLNQDKIAINDPTRTECANEADVSDAIAVNMKNVGEYAAQMSAIVILEFGVIFHSIFIGLTLAVSGEEFTTLFIVIVFHQTFEGLGLGSRLALSPWPESRKFMPYFLATAYGLTTPIAIAIGVALRAHYPPTARVTLLLNGIFDSISAGILIYVGCIELMAYELRPGSVMLNGSVMNMIMALALMCLGAGLMALLGKWA